MDRAGKPATLPASLWYPKNSYWHEHTLCPVRGSVNIGRPVSQHLCADGGVPGAGTEDVTAMLVGGVVG